MLEGDAGPSHCLLRSEVTHVTGASISQTRNATWPFLTARVQHSVVSHRSREEERSAENVAHKDRLPLEEMADEARRQDGRRGYYCTGRTQVTSLIFSGLEVVFL